MIWWSIDPGTSSGLAVWEGSTLTHAQLLNDSTTANALGGHDRCLCELETGLATGVLARPAGLVIELPQVYGERKTDPNDLILLAVLVGRVQNLVGVETQLVKPREWKGQVPKDVMVRRVWKALTEEERERIQEPRCRSLRHNLLDGVGIGLAMRQRLPGSPWRLG